MCIVRNVNQLSLAGTKLVMVTNLSSLFLNLLFLSLNLDIWKSCSCIPYNMSPQFSLLGFCRTNLSIIILLLESGHMLGICKGHMYFEALKCFFVGDSIFRQTRDKLETGHFSLLQTRQTTFIWLMKALYLLSSVQARILLRHYILLLHNHKYTHTTHQKYLRFTNKFFSGQSFENRSEISRAWL